MDVKQGKEEGSMSTENAFETLENAVQHISHWETLENALQAIEVLRNATQWQPMETCPQGKPVLLKEVSGRIGIWEYYGNGVNSVYIGWKEVE